MAGFPKGSRLDDLNNNRTPGSYGKAMNMVLNKESILETENGFVVERTYDKPNAGIISFPNGYILFLTNGSIDEIGINRSGVYTVVFRSAKLGFSIEHPVKGVYTFNRDGDLIIVWTDETTDIKILNVDHPQFTHGLDINKYLIDNNDLDLINIFTSTSKLNVNVVDIVDNGGSLYAGSYQIAIAYGFIDGTITPANELSNCIPIIKDESTLRYNEVDGGSDGESTSKAIRFSLSEVNSIYDGVYVYVYYKGTKTNEYVKRSPMFNNITVNTVIEIGSITDWDLVDIKEVIIDKSIYTTCKDLAVVDNQLMIVGPTGIPIYDIKAIAAATSIKWTYEETVNLDQVKGSYKDAKTVYAKKGFRPGEVYAFYLGLKLKKGGYLPIEHIPGRTARFGETTPYLQGAPAGINAARNANFINIATDVLPYQIEDTCGTDFGVLKGIMGYWENKNEVYDVDSTLTGNVRHHKFPSLNYLQSTFLQGSALISNPGVFDLTNISVYDETSIYKAMSVDVTNDGNNFTTSSLITVTHNQSDTIITSLNTQTLKLNIAYTLGVSVAFPSKDTNGVLITDCDVRVTLQMLVSQLNGAARIEGPNNINNIKISINSTNTFTCSWTADVAMLANEVLTIRGMVLNNTPSGHASLVTINVTPTLAKSSFSIGYVNINTAPLQGRVLGIEVSGVVIPTALKDVVEGWEVFYAERGIEDMTRISQSILVDNTYIGNPSISAKYCNFHGFDLQVSGINVNPTHTETQYALINTAINNSSRVNSVTHNSQLFVSPTNLNKVIDSRYVPANFTSEDITINNRYKEAALRLKLDTEYVGSYYNVVDLCSIKNNVFLDYHIQKPVSTGLLVDANNIVATIFGGDTFLSMYTIHLFKPDDTGVIKDTSGVKTTVYNGRMPYTITIPVYSTYNIGLRTEGITATEKLYPTTPIVLSTEFPNRDIYFGYNQVYTGLNNVTKVILRPRFNVFTNLFPNRLHLSLKPTDEAAVLNWRTFLAGDYKTVPFNKGAITGVQVQGNQVIIACEYATFKIGIKDVLNTEGFDAYLKRGELFDRPVEELIRTNDGFIGTKHKFAMTTNELGTFIVDSDKRKVYIISDGLKELVKDGYVNEMSNVLNMASSEFPDNPFFLLGCTLSIDRLNDRILMLVTKDNISSIYSYSYLNNCWVSEHNYLTESSYNAKVIFSNREGTYIMYNAIATDKTGTSKVIKITPRVGDTVTKQSTHWIEAILSDNLPTKKLYQSLAWNTRINGLIQNITFDKVQIHAGSQGTIAILVPEVSSRKNPVTGNIQDIKGLWVFGNIVDTVVNHDIDTFSRGLGNVNYNLEGYEVGSDRNVQSNTYYKVFNKHNSQVVSCVYNGVTYTEDMIFKTDATHLQLTSNETGSSVCVYIPLRNKGRVVNDHLIATFVYNGTEKLFISDINAKFINII